jgi:hypothetical protein
MKESATRKLKRERATVCLNCRRFVKCDNIGRFEECVDFEEVEDEKARVLLRRFNSREDMR